MATKDSGVGGGGKRPTGSTGRNRNAYCSFCRKSYRDVGPLVEGPGDVFICGECIELCQSIIDQEKRRRGVSKTLFTHIPNPRSIKEKLDQYVIGQQPSWPVYVFHSVPRDVPVKDPKKIELNPIPASTFGAWATFVTVWGLLV